MKHYDLLLYSWTTENKWLTQALKLLDQHGTLPVNQFCAELAFLCDISMVTSMRYLQKHSAPSACLVVKSGCVSIKQKQNGKPLNNENDDHDNF